MFETCGSRLRKIRPFLAAGVVMVCLLQPEAAAQGCAMCKTAAEAQPEPAITALGRAILFLLTPPVAIMGTILVYTFRKDSFRRDA
jgi:hypothetical protein